MGQSVSSLYIPRTMSIELCTELRVWWRNPTEPGLSTQWLHPSDLTSYPEAHTAGLPFLGRYQGTKGTDSASSTFMHTGSIHPWLMVKGRWQAHVVSSMHMYQAHRRKEAVNSETSLGCWVTMQLGSENSFFCSFSGDFLSSRKASREGFVNQR